MHNESRSYIHLGRSTSFRFHVEKRTTIVSIHCERRLKWESGGTMEDGRCILWAQCTSSLSAADDVMCEQPPYIVTSLSLGREGVAVVSSLRWELMEDTTVSICLTRPSETPVMLQELKKSSLSLITRDTSDKLAGDGSPGPLCNVSLESQYDFTVTLVGVTALSLSQPSLWRPLLCFRWFELREHVREATAVAPLDVRSSTRRNAVPAHASRMVAGNVREASALSHCGNYILWRDGSLGLRRELVPYRRLFTPAREDKRVRVRTFPHRYSDVVGEVPFGTCVEVIGRAMDRYTKEEYALLILSGTPDAAVVAETYGLRYIEPGKWLWGWSKITTCRGIVLLAELHNAESSKLHDKDWIERLQEPTYYTSVREGRRVRIRSEPSLDAEVIGHLDSNEVKLVVAVHHPPESSASHQNNSALFLYHFVEWKDGGFSLMRNNDRVYLVPVELQSPPRHFPVCPRPTPKSPEVVPLVRKRVRSASSSSQCNSFDVAATSPQEGLWSPANVPEAVAAGVKAGSVRLEDLPIINLDTKSESSFSSADTCS